jgi:SAM-dependent methyltransferase
MDQEKGGLRGILSSPRMFNLLQTLVGAGGLRSRYVREFIHPAPGARILDIGCGTGAILDHLPEGIDYEGYDLAPEYIEYAQRRYAGRGRFFCERVSRLTIREPHRFDIVLASALLHHLGDEEAKDLFRVAALSLKPGGVLITYDNVYVDGQSRLARYFISRDRGRHVRTPAEYEALARAVFARVETSTRHDLLRIPYTHFFMTYSDAGIREGILQGSTPDATRQP